MAETGLPLGWEVRQSTSKKLPYYFNSVEKVSRWEPPVETDTEKLKHYMATYHSQRSSIPQAAQTTSSSDAGEKIRAAHLLVKHRESRRPSSWREAQITRTKEDALGILQGHEQRIKSGEIGLGELATTESDCGSARKSGDLGFFGRGDMVKEFEETAFGLNVGEISGPVDGPSGWHLIQRLA